MIKERCFDIKIYTDEQLQNLVEIGIMDSEDVCRYKMKRAEMIIENHPYSIWQGNNGRWFTYLPDPGAPKNRKMRSRASKQDLLIEIVEYWMAHKKEDIDKEINDKSIGKNACLKEIFPKWIDHMSIHTKSTSYIKRITADWKRFYMSNVELINKPLAEMTKLYLDEWAHTTIRNMELTKKAYYNMSMILRCCIDYAVELKIVKENVFRNVKINTKLFRKVKKKPGLTQVYTEREALALQKDMMNRLQENETNLSPLAVMFVFETGVRIAELCALKFSDIEDKYIHIQRQEIRVFERIDEKDPTCAMRFTGFSIEEYTKTEEGDRMVYLTGAARAIISMAKKIADDHGFSNPDDFIFVKKDGANINHHAIQAMLVCGCNKIGIDLKSCHKIRKTYISTLIDSGLNIDEIRRMVGHTDERTTYGNYCYNRLTNEQTEATIDGALNSLITLITDEKTCIA